MKRQIGLVMIGWSLATLACAGEATLPPGAVMELRLTGKEQFGPAFEKSAMGMIWNDPKMKTFLERPKEWVATKMQKEGGGQDGDSARKLIRKLLAKPGAMGVYPGAKIGVVWVSALGADAAEFDKLLAATRKNVHLGLGEGQDRSVVIKDTFLFASSPELMTAAKAALEKPPAPVGQPALAAGTRVGWLHADMPGVLKMLRAQIEQSGNAGKFDAAVKALGADGIRQLDMALSIDGPGMRFASRLATGGQPTGLVKTFTSLAPLDDEALKLLPRDTVKGSVARLNLAAVWDAVMEAIKSAAGEADWKRFETERGELEQKVGFKFREDLVASIGDLMAFYSKGSVGPMMPGESALMVTLQDPAKFSACLDKLVAYANQNLGGQPGQMRGSIQTAEANGQKTYTLVGLPFFMPSWMVKNGRLIVSMSAASLSAATEQFSNPKSSLLDNEDFRKSRQGLPARGVVVSYEDTKQTVAAMYGMVAMLGPMMAAQAGMDLPVDMSLLPPLANIQEKLFGTVSVMTADAQGLTVNSYGPFGGNTGFSAGGGIAAGMLLPALSNAREKARQVSCSNNLKQIGLACVMFADEHKGKFPDKLQDLSPEYLKEKKIFHCPTAPGNPDSLNYGYVPGLTMKDSDKILAFDADGNHRTGRNVLFGDCHIQWMLEAQFQETIRRQTK